MAELLARLHILSQRCGGTTMKKLLTISLLVSMASCPAFAQGALNQSASKNQFIAYSKAAVAFVNVNVIPMTGERVLPDQTVVVRDGRIASIGPSKRTRAPKDALVVDGRGLYLMPGLVDMHSHLFSDDEFPDELAGDELAIMLANGVTTIRLMIGTPEHLVLRERVKQGELLGPTIYAASPQLAGRSFGNHFNGRAVTNADEASRAVRDFKAAGYDFIKLTFWISRPVYDAVIETAKEVGIRVIGHVDPQVGLTRALEARQQIEHLDSYFEAVLADNSPLKVSVSGTSVWRMPNWESMDYIDENKIQQVAKATVKAGVWSCPTLTFLKLAFGTGQTDEEIQTRPDYRFIPQKLRDEMAGPRQHFWQAPPTAERRQKYVSVRNKLVKALYDAGGKIMAGSDAPEWYLLYGYTLHRELRNLVEAGLPPYAALEAATRNPAEFFGALDQTGTVETGKRADLLLLEANPLADVSNTERRAGVMARGRWLPQSELQQMLDRIAPRFQAAFNAPN
jgi:imidazolonepropionase-like amidohydrolase